MANEDLYRKVNFSDGEGLEHEDFNRMGQTAEARLVHHSSLGGGRLGNVFRMGQKVSGSGGALMKDESTDPASGLLPNIMLDPHPLTGPFAGAGFGADWFVESGLFGQVHNASLPGVRPADSPSPIFASLEAEGGTPALAVNPFIQANVAPAAGNPRWDVYGLRLGYGVSNLIARDFEDAETRQLTSVDTEKDQLLTVEEAYGVGSQVATYDPTTAIAALPAGFVPCLVIRRPVGSGTTVTAADLYYLGVPMRVGVEDVMGYEAHFAGNSAYDAVSAFAPRINASNPGGGAAYLGANAASAVDYFPRTLHDGCRLVGIGFAGGGMTNDSRVSIVRHDYTAAGVQSATIIADLDNASSSGRLNGAAAGGYEYVSGVGSDPDWAIPGGALWPTPGLPIWGNGHAGPSAAERTLNRTAFSRIGVRITEESGQTFVAADLINFIRFVYLH